MPYTRADVKAAVIALVQDDADFVTPDELEIYIDTALEILNSDRPFELRKDISGDDTQDYALPSEFEKGYSDIDSVEVPAGKNPPVLRDRTDDWYLYEDPSKGAGLQNRLRFRETTPATGETIRITIRTPYTLTATVTTLDLRAYAAIKVKAAGLYFRALGAQFAQTTNPTIAADAVDYAGRSQNYLLLAERYDANYNRILGIEGKVKPAAVLAEADIAFAHGEDFLWHTRRFR